MTLSEYMKAKAIDDAAMAATLGGCSPSAVKKWRYGERTPRPRQMARIKEATDGVVTADDFLRAEAPADPP